jgi:hypothetical protein
MDIDGWRSGLIINYGSSSLPWEGNIDETSPLFNKIEVSYQKPINMSGSNENHLERRHTLVIAIQSIWKLGLKCGLGQATEVGLARWGDWA